MTGCAGTIRKPAPRAPDTPPRAGAAPRPRTRSTALGLRAEPAAVPAARRHARATLRAWGLPALADDAETIVAELVTNAVRATAALPPRPGGPPPVRLAITTTPDDLTIRVWDASPALPRPAPPCGPGDGPGGRGLLIVAALAASHGTRPAPGGGKHVWARLTPHPPRPPPPARPPVPASTPTTRPEKREHTP
jgi:anti-sigma regulatory factor (Ser/Thr protein kinase)